MSNWGLPAAAAVGLLLGIGARLVDHVAPRWVGDAAAFWVLAAFCTGLWAPDLRKGAMHGLTCLLTGCAGYYLWRVWIDERIWPDFLLTVGLFWFVAALSVGVAAGSVGAASKRDRSFWGVAAGAFIGEGVAVMALGGVGLQPALEIVIGLALLMVARIQLRRAMIITVAVTIAVALVGIGYRTALGARKALRRADIATSFSEINEGPPRWGRPLIARDLRRSN